MPKTYLFYDIEATGLNKSFDQVVQFAAIRTDLDLNPIEEIEFFVTLSPDVVPSPYASMTHHIPIKTCQEKGLSEYEAICRIHQLLNTPDTVSLGYNTLTFDDEFLRFSFYQHLLAPYTHQYANGCSRMDIYPMTVLYYLFKPEVLDVWPTKNGTPSMKLELINKANSLAKGAAHDALVDVKATLALAKKFKQVPDMWQYLIDYFDKKTDQARIDKLPKKDGLTVGLLALPLLGSRYRYLAPVLLLGTHKKYNNQQLLLRLDLSELAQSTPNNFTDTTWVIRKKLGENGFILPMSERFMAPIDAKRLALVESNLAFLKAQPELLELICAHYTNWVFPTIEKADISSTLYQQGFWNQQEKRQCAAFHDTPDNEKPALLTKWSEHEPLYELALRVTGRLAYSALSDPQKTRFDTYLEQALFSEEPLIDYTGKEKFTTDKALHEINIIEKKGLTSEQQTVITELQAYLEEKMLAHNQLISGK